MVVRSAQRCTEALDGLLAGKYLVTVAFTEGSEYYGCVITDIVPGSLSDLKGCKIGEVIVGLEPIDIAIANGDEEVKFVRSETYTVRKLSEDYVKQLLRLRATRMKLIVARPRGSVARQVAEWTSQLRAANDALLGSLRANECLWFCDECRAESVNHTEISAERIRREAKHCLALVKRLKQESFAIHQDTEDHVPAENILGYESEDKEIGAETLADIHFSCVSLERLECMMKCILKKDLQQNYRWLESAFFVGGTGFIGLQKHSSFIT